jgi:hypothetical protein
MAGLKSESLIWLDQLETLIQLPSPKRSDIQKALNVQDSHITKLQAIKTCFDQKAKDKVRSAAQDNAYIFSFNNAVALSKLIPRQKGSKGQEIKTADLSTFHTALDTALTRRLTTRQIKDLVDWIKDGNPADSFTESAQPRRAPRLGASAQVPETFKESEPGKKEKTHSKTAQKTSSVPDTFASVMVLAKPALQEEERNDISTIHRDRLKALLQTITAKTVSDEDSEEKEKPGKKSKSASDINPSPFWEWMLGVSFISQLRKKVKKGIPLTNAEKCFVLLHWIYEGLAWAAKNIWKHLFEPGVKSTGRLIKAIFGKGFSKVAEWILPVLLICVLIWGIGKVYQFAMVNPLHWLESKIKSGFHWGGHPDEQPTPQIPISSMDLGQSNRTPQHEASGQMPTPQIPISSMDLGQPKPVSRPVVSTRASSQKPAVVYQPAIAFQPAVEDQQILEDEIDAIGPKRHVKDHVVTPDEGIPGDVAVSRVRDLADPDKYTMKIGKDKQTLLSANVTTTGLTINYKSADLFGNLTGSGGGQWNVLWEDINAIHVSEIVSETNEPVTYFQFSAIAEGAKIPFTLQCATTANLQHLVSALEYFIRNSRLGHDAPPGGMPYPDQGLRFTGTENVVSMLWADSPADKAGLALGDRLWSVEKVSNEQQGSGDIEKGLQTLPAVLFVVSPSDWDKALAAKNTGAAKFLSPKLRKVIMNTF